MGELLQPGGVAALQKVGLEECLEGIDPIPVRGYEILYRGENITFYYPPTESKNDPIWLREEFENGNGQLTGQRVE